MLRTLDVILICGMVSAAAWTYKVKNDAQIAVDRVVFLEKQLAEEKAEIAILRADWSLFTSPERLQQLVDKFQEELKLNPVESSQISNFEGLPPRRFELENQRNPLMDGFAEADRDLKTGSVPLVGGTVKPKAIADE